MRVREPRGLAVQVEGLQRTVIHLAATVTQLLRQLEQQRQIGRGAEPVGFAKWSGWLGRRDRDLHLPAPRPNIRRGGGTLRRRVLWID